MPINNFSRRGLLVAGISALTLPHVATGQATQRDVEGGIGGTGIVGILTDFGSLIVGGNYLRTDGQSRYTDAFGQVRAEDLRLGDSLTVEAAGSPGALAARRVHITHPLQGPISAVLEGGRRLVVNGVSVVLDVAPSNVQVGMRVAVSGLWRGDTVVASRIAPAKSAQDLVSGDLTRGFGRLQIGSVVVRGSGLSGLEGGSFVTAVGQYDAATDRLQVQDVQPGRFFGAAGPLQRLSIEGYLTPTQVAPGYRVAGLGHSFERNLRLAEFANSRVLFNGGYTGKFAADSAVVLPDAFAPRRRILRRLSQTNG